MLGRYSSAIRAACANERSCGSVRGAISDDRPYRDLIDRVQNESKQICYGGIRKLPIPNVMSGNQEVQSLRGFQRERFWAGF
jgi:hypothetical protein